jgi:hypothetical protein
VEQPVTGGCTSPRLYPRQLTRRALGGRLDGNDDHLDAVVVYRAVRAKVMWDTQRTHDYRSQTCLSWIFGHHL